jgi:F-type H+-transporting ATPase subunit delta
MKSTRSASRYAKALMDLAVERNELETVKNDVLLAQTAVANTRDLQIFLNSPVVKPKVKQKILSEIFEKHLSEALLVVCAS